MNQNCGEQRGGEMSNYGMHKQPGFGRDDQENLKRLNGRLEKEEVTNPKHYNELKSEPLDYIIANELDFLEGNIVKYVSRYTYKGGVNDLLKARTYLEKLIEREKDGR